MYLMEFVVSGPLLLAFEIVGGLGIFLYGIDLMGNSLKKLAGNRLKIIIEKSTNTPIKGIFVGILVTAIIQSSSGTTAIIISLVRANLMTMPQAVGVIIGANIGTTVTALLMSLNIKQYALPIMAIGSMLVFFTKRKKLNYLGEVLLGFGMLFYGLGLMGTALKEVATYNWFEIVLLESAHIPILGLIIGALATGVVQSSSAVVGIVLTLYESGNIKLIGALAIVLGSNIGTTVTAIISAYGGSTAAKRTATAHVLFNLIGSIIFLIFIIPYTIFIQFVETNFFNGDKSYTIAFAHFTFNLINAIIFLFFINRFVWLVKKIWPIDPEDEENLFAVDTLSDNLIDNSPILALESAKVVIESMGKVARKMLKHTTNYSFFNEQRSLEKGQNLEETTDLIDKKVHDYLVKIAQHDLGYEGSQLHATYIDTIRDYERMGDHCQNILEIFELRYDAKMVLSEKANNDLTKLYELLANTVDTTNEAFQNYDKLKAYTVIQMEDEIDRLVIKYRKRHIKRMNDQETSRLQDDYYVDILSNIERIGDHCNNIVNNIIVENYYTDVMDLDD